MSFRNSLPFGKARVAELADALDLGSSGETRPGSTPGSRSCRPPSMLDVQHSMPRTQNAFQQTPRPFSVPIFAAPIADGQVRSHLAETARRLIETMVEGVTVVKMLSMHHDVSTVTAEEVVPFTLEAAAAFRGTSR
jgi:hypothetical protein